MRRVSERERPSACIYLVATRGSSPGRRFRLNRPRRAPMLDARDYLLANKAALVEIDSAELIHVRIVWEGVAIDKIKPAARDRMRDAMRLVGGGLHQFGSELVRCLAREVRCQHAAHAEIRQSRIA